MKVIKGKGISILAECEDCGEKFSVSKDNVNYQKEHTLVDTEETILLTSYDCPKCGRRHFVQIDDKNTIRRNAQASGQFRKLAKKQVAGGEVSQSQNDKFKHIRKDLAKTRNELMQKYQGKKVCNEYGEEFILRFSI